MKVETNEGIIKSVCIWETWVPLKRQLGTGHLNLLEVLVDSIEDLDGKSPLKQIIQTSQEPSKTNPPSNETTKKPQLLLNAGHRPVQGEGEPREPVDPPQGGTGVRSKETLVKRAPGRPQEITDDEIIAKCKANEPMSRTKIIELFGTGSGSKYLRIRGLIDKHKILYTVYSKKSPEPEPDKPKPSVDEKKIKVDKAGYVFCAKDNKDRLWHYCKTCSHSKEASNQFVVCCFRSKGA